MSIKKVQENPDIHKKHKKSDTKEIPSKKEKS